LSEIIIEEPVLEEGRLTSKITTSKNLEKYIHDRELFIEYDVDIYTEDSILNLPLTASVLPLAWLTGSDIHVKALDRTFKESMDELQKFLAKMYPKGLFTAEIKAETLVENKIEPENPERRTGVLFSGGADSFYSLINNIQHNPRLITIWGSDDFPYPESSDHWEKAISTYQKYAKKKNLELHILKTNISQILNFRKIEHTYHKELYDGKLRGALQHSLVLLPPAAPISMGRFDRFIIAATNTPEHDYQLKPRATSPSADEKISWADLSVKHDGQVDRYKKIERIVDYHVNDEFSLRVCSRSAFIDGIINDSKCPKCLKTIVCLILAGFDPNLCGFNVDESTFEFLRSMWENNDKASTHGGGWKSIQDSLPAQLDIGVNGSKEFFEWFRGFDLEAAERNWFYNDLYMWLPFRLSKILDKVYSKYVIALHQGSYNRDYERIQKKR